VSDLDAFMMEPIDWNEYEEATLALLDNRGGEFKMPRKIHGKGVRATPQPKPVKAPKKGK
jgi:hypothetical protein